VWHRPPPTLLGQRRFAFDSQFRRRPFSRFFRRLATTASSSFAEISSRPGLAACRRLRLFEPNMGGHSHTTRERRPITPKRRLAALTTKRVAMIAATIARRVSPEIGSPLF
jgi:hypothetical protein